MKERKGGGRDQAPNGWSSVEVLDQKHMVRNGDRGEVTTALLD